MFLPVVSKMPRTPAVSPTASVAANKINDGYPSIQDLFVIFCVLEILGRFSPEKVFRSRPSFPRKVPVSAYTILPAFIRAIDLGPDSNANATTPPLVNRRRGRCTTIHDIRVYVRRVTVEKRQKLEKNYYATKYFV